MEGHDRGAFGEITFRRCERGFMLHAGPPMSGMIGQVFAFDRIEDLAAWLIEQYTAPPPAADSGPVPATDQRETIRDCNRILREKRGDDPLRGYGGHYGY